MLLAGLVVMVVSLSGVIFLLSFTKKILEKNLPFLISFSAGVFLVTALVLLFEAMHIFDSFYALVGAVLLGYGLAWGVHYLFPETHHHHDDQECHKTHKGAKKILVGDGIHNIADGIVIAVSFAVSPVIGIASTLSILFHEILQEISEFFVLKRAGFSTKQALVINFAVSSTIMIGIAIGSFALVNANLEGFLLAVSSGFFLHIVGHDIFPRYSHHLSSRMFFAHLILVAVGILTMYGIRLITDDGHAHGDLEIHQEAHDEQADHHEDEEEGHYHDEIH